MKSQHRDALLVASLLIFKPGSPLQRGEEIEHGY
jgi:hypothetical protein